MRFHISAFARTATLVAAILSSAGFAAARVPVPPQDQPATAPSDPQQQSTLGEAARRARKQKKEQAKATHTWDNENIPKTPNGLSVVGQTPSSADTNAAPAANADGSNPPPADASAPNSQGSSENSNKPLDAKAKVEAEAQLSAAKDLLQSLQKDLDILQRQYTLDQQSFYGKPNFAADKDGAAALKAESDQVEAKRQEVAAAQAKVDALQAKVGPPPAEPTQPN